MLYWPSTCWDKSWWAMSVGQILTFPSISLPLFHQTGKGGRTMPNILDDIIASVVENKIPASRQNTTTKLSIKHEPVTPGNNNPTSAVAVDTKPDRKKTAAVTAAVPEESTNQHPDIPHCWLYNRRLLWLKDHRNQNNWKLFRECWRQGQVHIIDSTSSNCSGSSDNDNKFLVVLVLQ